MNNFNILFTSVGRRVSLVQSFQKALCSLEITGKIVTTDCQKSAPASFIANVQEQVPRVTNKNYISCLIEICKKHDIKLLIPLIDPELYLLSLHKKEFEAIGVTLLVSSPRVNQMCANKRATYDFFKSIGVSTPEIFEFDKLLVDDQAEYPLLIKPVDGSCSVGVTKINNFQELVFFKDYIPNAIVQEFVVGEEYTLDILVDDQGKVRSIVPRLRMETRAGEVSKAITVKNYKLISATKKIVESLPGAFGCITVQCFLQKNGEIKFIEMNPRFGGGFPLSFQAGADFPRWIIEIVLGKDPEIEIDNWQDDLAMLRYDNAIFVKREMIT